MARTLVTAPDVYPVTRAEAKAHLRVDTGADDTYIDALIDAATAWCETYTERRFVTQTWDLKLDGFWDHYLYVPYPPLASVSSISYVDTDGATQTLSSSVYTVDTDSEPGRIYLAWNQTWPSTRSVTHAVTVRFVCGYGLAASVPARAKQAILIAVADMYENREEILTGTTFNRLPVLSRLLDSLRVPEEE